MQTIIDVEKTGLEIKSELGGLRIVDQATYDKACDAMKRAKLYVKETEAFFAPMKAKAHAAWKEVCNQETNVVSPVKSVIQTISREVVRWDDEQKRIRREAQRRLEEEARKRAEDERIAQAVALEQSGAHTEVVEAVLETPVVAVPVVAPSTFQKSNAAIVRETWTAEVTDLHALVKAAAKDKNLLGLLQVNQSALNGMARALKETMSIPGVKAVPQKSVATR